jgi:hypothetical protein
MGCYLRDAFNGRRSHFLNCYKLYFFDRTFVY